MTVRRPLDDKKYHWSWSITYTSRSWSKMSKSIAPWLYPYSKVYDLKSLWKENCFSILFRRFLRLYKLDCIYNFSIQVNLNISGTLEIIFVYSLYTVLMTLSSEKNWYKFAEKYCFYTPNKVSRQYRFHSKLSAFKTITANDCNYDYFANLLTTCESRQCRGFLSDNYSKKELNPFSIALVE